MDHKKRWIALIILCMGALMIVLDSTIVNVALPSIKTDLNFSATNLAWIVNAYMLTFGGFLLLGGRFGDLFGPRKIFLMGIALFTLASLGCGLATGQGYLLAARAVQGLGGAVVSAVALSLIMNLFQEPGERAKAMGFYGFVAAGGGSLGVLLGGLLTTLNWHLIFLVNIPIGIAVFICSYFVLPHSRTENAPKHLDAAGAILVTLALITAVYAVVNGNDAGWFSTRTIGTLGFAVLLFAIFVYVESKVRAPLIPLGFFRLRNIRTANIMGVLWSASMFAWFFLSALYMQLVLGYKPLQIGLAFLPANIIMAIFSIGVSARLVVRFGIKKPLAGGLFLAAIGLAILARAPVAGNYLVDILPSMILLGFGAGAALNPMLLAAMDDLSSEQSGLASGLVNTSFMMGGALGLAILASIAAALTGGLLASGAQSIVALTGGYHAAFLTGAIFALSASLLGAFVLRINRPKAGSPAQ